MKISFCTTCMGRTHHLKQTLPANIEANKGYPNAQFVVVNYNSKDDLADFIRSRMQTHIDSGRLLYVEERTAKYFEKCHAKNIAHVVAGGDILVNVDADNYTGPGYAEMLAAEFKLNPRIVLTTTQQISDMVGRVALPAEVFRGLRGYDEALLGYGVEDVDIVKRARAHGMGWRKVDHPGCSHIPHSAAERSENLEGRPNHCRSNNKNQERVKARQPGHIINKDGWGRAMVWKNFSPDPTWVGVESVLA